VRFVLLIAFAVALMTEAVAQKPRSPKEIFDDDQVLQGASAEILGMSYQNLNALKRMLSECSDQLSKNEIIQHTCTVARSDYQIEFGSGGQLDSLIYSIDLTIKILRLQEGARTNADSVKMIMRLGDINIQLERVANERFKILRAAGQLPQW